MTVNKVYFSIIIPLYNKEDFVKKTLESVLCQTYPYFELIIVDDGSTDNSIMVVESILDNRLKIIKQKNSGVSAARNTGINNAKYELIAFLDADDWWHHKYLELMLQVINRFPRLYIYASRYSEVINNRNFTPQSLFTNDEKVFAFDLIDVGSKNKNASLPLHTSSTIIRKTVLPKAGLFDEKISFFEDYDFFLRIGIHSKVGYLNDISLSFYSKDVPVQMRATGKLVPLKTHFVSHIDKFDFHAQKNRTLQKYINKFILFSLYKYKLNAKELNYVKDLTNNINIYKYPLKYIIVYKFPNFVSFRIVRLMAFLKRVKRF